VILSRQGTKHPICQKALCLTKNIQKQINEKTIHPRSKQSFKSEQENQTAEEKKKF